ncbi:MAG: hypothetical protein M5R40_24310 [Anaerolineae bacterium]|nr:hypothetical protein [Anaerolineae bacterium]
MVELDVHATMIEARAGIDAFTLPAFRAALQRRWPDAWAIYAWQMSGIAWAGGVMFLDDALNHVTVAETGLYDALALGIDPGGGRSENVLFDEIAGV